MDNSEMLDLLYSYQLLRDDLAAEEQKLVDAVIPDDIKAKITEIREEFTPRIQNAQKQIADLTAAIKTAVEQVGQSVEGKYLRAQYRKGAVTCDIKLVQGLALVIPDLNQALSQGKPSVAIVEIKRNDTSNKSDN